MNMIEMGLHQLKTALLVLDDRLLRFSKLKISFYQAEEVFFIQKSAAHLMLCLHLMEPN